mmetsp:Transcript_22468/g.50717  ORF Transcript_22468/g.50717 Transcript_22468/m.50717 type:complete len:230 (+) Transcript_22468:347-1036(+)
MASRASSSRLGCCCCADGAARATRLWWAPETSTPCCETPTLPPPAERRTSSQRAKARRQTPLPGPMPGPGLRRPGVRRVGLRRARLGRWRTLSSICGASSTQPSGFFRNSTRPSGSACRCPRSSWAFSLPPRPRAAAGRSASTSTPRWLAWLKPRAPSGPTPRALSSPWASPPRRGPATAASRPRPWKRGRQATTAGRSSRRTNSSAALRPAEGPLPPPCTRQAGARGG